MVQVKKSLEHFDKEYIKYEKSFLDNKNNKNQKLIQITKN